MSYLRPATQALRSSYARGTSSRQVLQRSLLSHPASFHTSAARWALSADARKKIDAAVNGHDLVVFMKGTPDLPMCGFSRAVCQILEVQGVAKDKMKTYNCLDDQELREGIKEYSSWPTIPQVFLKQDFLGGCDILLSMHQSGELEELLSGAGLIPKPATNAAESKA